MASKEDNPLGITISKLPNIESGELVEVCELFSPAHFYLHRVEDKLKVNRMMGEMRKAYGMSVDRRQLWLNPAEVELGMIVAARWGGEGWHRVKVVGFRPSKVEVVYVDFGSRGNVRRDQLFRLLPHFLETPPLAIAASLTVKARPPATCWADTEATLRLHALVEPDAQVPLKAIVLEESGRIVLDLLDLSSGESISELLVKERLAVFEGTRCSPQELATETAPRLLTRSVVDGVVKKVNRVPVLPVMLLPQLEKLVEQTALVAGGQRKREVVMSGQEQLVSDTLALSLQLVKTKWEVKKEKIEGWVERRKCEAAEKSLLEKASESVTSKSLAVVSTESDSGIASGATSLAKTFDSNCSSSSLVTLPSMGGVLHLHKIHNEVFVAGKKVSAMVPGFKGRDLVMDRMAAMGIKVPTAGLEGQLMPLKIVPSMLQLICPEAVDTIEDIKGLRERCKKKGQKN